MKEGMMTLSEGQLKTFTVINRFMDKSISRQQAAELRALSTRQLTGLKKGILVSNAESLIHKNTGRKPVHAVLDEQKKATFRFTPPRIDWGQFPLLQRYPAYRFRNLSFQLCSYQFTKRCRF